MNLKEWKSKNHDRYRKLLKMGIITSQDVEDMNNLGIHSMGKLNRNAAELVNKYQAGACTDVTGFGILGHLENLAEAQQRKNLDLRLEKLPILGKADLVENEIMDFKLQKGYSAETSGGLMAILDPSCVDDFQQELEMKYGEKSWVIGQVYESHGENKATLSDEKELIYADSVF